MEAVVKLNAPVIIQFSNGGAAFNAGKSLSTENQNLQSLVVLLVQDTSTH